MDPSSPSLPKKLRALFSRASGGVPPELVAVVEWLSQPTPAVDFSRAPSLSDALQAAQAAPVDAALTPELRHKLKALPEFSPDVDFKVRSLLVLHALATEKIACVSVLLETFHKTNSQGLPGLSEQVVQCQLRDPFWLDRLPTPLFKMLRDLCERSLANPEEKISREVWQRVWAVGGLWALDNQGSMNQFASMDQWKAWFSAQPIDALAKEAIAPLLSGATSPRFPVSHWGKEQRPLLEDHPDYASGKAQNAVLDVLAQCALPPPGGAGPTVHFLDLARWVHWSLEKNASRLTHPGTVAWKQWLAEPFSPTAACVDVPTLREHWNAVMSWDAMLIAEGWEREILFEAPHLPALLAFVHARPAPSDSAAGREGMWQSDLDVVESQSPPLSSRQWLQALDPYPELEAFLPPRLKDAVSAEGRAQALDQALSPPEGEPRRFRL